MIHFQTHDKKADVTLSNPRREAEFGDWPLGGSKRGKCRFYVETKAGKGERVCRVTESKTGGWNKPKMMTFSTRQCVCDGSDGRTYILTYTDTYGGITIYTHDMFQAANYYRDGNASDREIFADLMRFFLTPLE